MKAFIAKARAKARIHAHHFAHGETLAFGVVAVNEAIHIHPGLAIGANAIAAVLVVLHLFAESGDC